MSDPRTVTKAEFDAFIEAFPRDLTRDVTGICSPPIRRYCDFSEGKKWPEAVVADVILNSCCPYRPEGAPDEYRIWA